MLEMESLGNSRSSGYQAPGCRGLKEGTRGRGLEGSKGDKGLGCKCPFLPSCMYACTRAGLTGT